MEQGQHGQADVAAFHRVPDQPANACDLYSTMGVDAALGGASGPRGIRDHGQIVGCGLRCIGGDIFGHRIGPADNAGALDVSGVQLPQRVGQWDVTGRIGQFAVMGGDDGFQVAFFDNRGGEGQKFLPRQHNIRARVFGVMDQFRVSAHGVDGDHGSVGPQDGIVSDDELRAVLHVQQHPIPAFHASAFLQIPGQRLHLRVQVRIGQGMAVIDDRGLVRGAGGGVDQVLGQRLFGQVEMMRNAFGPDFEVTVKHGDSCGLGSDFHTGHVQ